MALLNFQFKNRDGPLLVVASGRDTVSVAAAVKKLAPEATFVVQVRSLILISFSNVEFSALAISIVKFEVGMHVSDQAMAAFLSYVLCKVFVKYTLLLLYT